MPSAPVWSAEDYTTALLAMQPQGILWSRDPTSVRAQVLAALAPTLNRLNQNAADLLNDAFPVQPVQLLPEWELSLGLPDTCTGQLPTIQARQQAVAAKFVDTGGQSIDYFVRVAAALGYEITVTEYLVSYGDLMCGDDLLHDDDGWNSYWLVNVFGSEEDYVFSGDVSFGDDYLDYYASSAIECILTAIAPAHTTLGFQYVKILGDNIGRALATQSGLLLSVG